METDRRESDSRRLPISEPTVALAEAGGAAITAGLQRRRRWRAPCRPVRVTAGAVLVASLVITSSAAAQAPLLEQQVSFAVTNSNGTQVPCMTDGQTYTIRGEIVGPSALLSGASTPAAEVYVHDLSVAGAFNTTGAESGFWNFRDVGGYDYATQMASQGFVSVVLNELGYAPSGQPPGNSSCIGGQATILHQVIDDLKSGNYTVSGGAAAIRFKEAVTIGESIGAQIAEVEAYTFKDIAGLGVIGFSDSGPSEGADQESAMAAQVCLAGGQQANGTSGPSGYVYYDQTDSDFQSNFFNQSNADPAVVKAAIDLHMRAPCGDLNSIVPAILLDNQMDGQISVPALLVYGDKDSAFPASDAQQQSGLYTASKDVTTDVVHNAGHAFTLEYTAPTFRADIEDWLTRHLPPRATPPPPPQPQPKPTPHGPLLVLGQRPLTLSPRDRSVPIPVRCNTSPATSCIGVLTAYALYWRRHPLTGQPRLQPRLLGRVRFKVRGGATATLSITIASRTYRALAALRHGVVATAIARARVGPSTSVVARSVFNLRVSSPAAKARPTS